MSKIADRPRTFIDAEQCHPARMGSGGPGKPLHVIWFGRVMHYVGIGWVDERKAKLDDYDILPIVITSCSKKGAI